MTSPSAMAPIPIRDAPQSAPSPRRRNRVSPILVAHATMFFRKPSHAGCRARRSNCSRQRRAHATLASVAGNGANSLLKHVLEALKHAGIGTVVAVPLLAAPLPFSVIKIFVPELENPDGARKRRFGARALSRALEVA